MGLSKKIKQGAVEIFSSNPNLKVIYFDDNGDFFTKKVSEQVTEITRNEVMSDEEKPKEVTEDRSLTPDLEKLK